MRKLLMFNFISINGFYKASNGDISWHKHGKEENEFSADNLKQDAILIFGRITYDLMASYWPSSFAMENDPATATGMNKAEKIVISKSMKKADWNNTSVFNENFIDELKKLKQTSGKDMVILGSGSIVTQCAEAGIIDEYQIMLDPVAIGSGTPIFNDIQHQLELKLIKTRVFNSGTVLLTYQPL